MSNLKSDALTRVLHTVETMQDFSTDAKEKRSFESAAQALRSVLKRREAKEKNA